MHKKWSFPLRICSVNVTKSTVSCEILNKKTSLLRSVIYKYQNQIKKWLFLQKTADYHESNWCKSKPSQHSLSLKIEHVSTNLNTFDLKFLKHLATYWIVVSQTYIRPSNQRDYQSIRYLRVFALALNFFKFYSKSEISHKPPEVFCKCS